MDTVRCCDCGFLTVFNPDTVQFEHATEQERKSGLFRFSSYPNCFVRAANLPDEADTLSKDGSRNPSFQLEVIKLERKCEKFCEWIQGFSPKEHREIQQETELRKWQEERLEADRKRQDEQRTLAEKRDDERRAADRDFQKEQKELDRMHQEEQANKSFRRTLLASFLSVLFGAALTALVSYFMKKDDPEKKEPVPIIIQMPDGKEIKSK